MKTIITEEHSSQLHVWHQLGVKDATLIYLDAHLDLLHISESRIEKIKQCSNNEALKQLEKPHHMVPDRGYSYSIEDFLYAASHLGIIDHVIWVHPTPNNQSPNPMDLIRMLQNRDGFGLKDFTKFEIVGNLVEATLLGVKVTICGYQDLPNLALPKNTFIDVDIDYFIALPEDHPWIDPRVVFDVLKSLPLNYDVVTFTRSVSSGYMPLCYSFIADYMAALWQNDLAEIEHYSRLYTFNQQAKNNEVEAARLGCLQEIEKYPNCAATYHLLSLCETDLEKAAEFEQKAGEICSSYSPNVLRSANAIASRDLKYNATTLKALEDRLNQGESNEEERHLAHFTLGVLYGMLGDQEHTLEQYQHCQKIQPGNYPELSFILASFYFDSKEYEAAILYLNNSLSDESTQAKSYTLLGKIYLEQKHFDLARDNLLLATQMLPGAKKPAKLLADLYKQIGDEINYRIQINKYHQMKLLIP